MIWVGSKHNLAKLQQCDLTLTVGTETIQPVNIVRNLGVWIDRELSMKQHVVKVAGACFHQLRHLRQIRRRVGREVTTRLVLALVMSRLDSGILSLPDYQHPQSTSFRVQNSAARLICNLKPCEHMHSVA